MTHELLVCVRANGFSRFAQLYVSVFLITDLTDTRSAVQVNESNLARSSRTWLQSPSLAISIAETQRLDRAWRLHRSSLPA